jgi:hypothetical protein
MKRRLLNLVARLSLALLLLVAAAWVWSLWYAHAYYWSEYRLLNGEVRHFSLNLSSGAGALGFEVYDWAPEADRLPPPETLLRVQREQGRGRFYHTKDPTNVGGEFYGPLADYGFGFRRVAVKGGYLLAASVPHWALLPPLAVLPAAAGVAERRRRRRRAGGLCARCGYDLRATPGTCPECGSGRQ